MPLDVPAPSGDRIELRGLQAAGICGALPEEREPSPIDRPPDVVTAPHRRERDDVERGLDRFLELLDGLDQYMRSFINLAVSVADEPRYATVNGLVKMFDDPKLLERVSRNELGVLQNAEIPFEV